MIVLPAMTSLSRASNPTAAALCLLCAVSYAVTGIAFFVDPSSQFRPGTPEYWATLANAPLGRLVFLMAFALAGITAFCTMPEIRRLIAPMNSLGRLAASLGQLGFGVTAISYVRLIGGEAQRAQAFAAGSEDVRQSIASFSLSLDPQGWLIFFSSGLCLLIFGCVGWRAGTIPRAIAALGSICGLLYIVAFAARATQHMLVVDIAAGLGAVVIGPIWWTSLALRFLTAPAQPSSIR